MNKKNILLIGIALTLVTVFVVACTRKVKTEVHTADSTEIPVVLSPVSSVTICEPIQASGFISSETEARLSFKTGGIIQRIYVEEGQSVAKGQLLATLNLTEINAQVEQAKEALEKAQRDYDRAKNLYRDTVATLEQFQNSLTGLNVAKQQYEMARFNLSYSEIRATADGKIVKKMVNEGEIVSAGMPVFFTNAASTNDWLVKAGVADKDWARLQLGNVAQVKIDAYPDQTFSGVVSQLSQAPDALSGLYQVEIKLKPSAKALATGLFAKTEITPKTTANYLSVPVDAVIEGDGAKAFVFTVSDKKAHKQAVNIGFMKDGKVMLTSGVDTSMQVITDGSAYLTDGATVKIMSPNTETKAITTVSR